MRARAKSSRTRTNASRRLERSSALGFSASIFARARSAASLRRLSSLFKADAARALSRSSSRSSRLCSISRSARSMSSFISRKRVDFLRNRYAGVSPNESGFVHANRASTLESLARRRRAPASLASFMSLSKNRRRVSTSCDEAFSLVVGGVVSPRRLASFPPRIFSSSLARAFALDISRTARTFGRT